MLHSGVPIVTRTLRLTRLLFGVAVAVSCHAVPDSTTTTTTRGVDIDLARELNVVDARVPARATLESLLRQNALPSEVTTSIVEAVRSVFNPRGLRVDQPYHITTTLDGLFREFRYDIDADRFLRVIFRKDVKDGESPYNVEVVERPKQASFDAVSAEITKAQPSLF